MHEYRLHQGWSCITSLSVRRRRAAAARRRLARATARMAQAGATLTAQEHTGSDQPDE